LNNDFATLEYVNASLAANTLNLFLTDTSSAEVGGYYEMLFSETGTGGSTLTENSVSDGETLLWSYISPQFAIADQISTGLYVVSIWVEQNSNKTVTFAAKLYKRNSGGTETELVETSTSDTVTKDTKTQIIMSGFLENDTPISSTDRVVLKIYSNISGGGGAPDITIYMEGTDDSRAAVRIPTSVITKKIFDADGDTYITVEETADEDKIHAYTAGTEVAEIDSTEFDIKKQLKISGVSCMRATRATVQSVPDSTWTIVQYNTEKYDNLGEYDNATNYRFTAQKTGYYHVDAGLLSGNYAWPSGSIWIISIYKNGTSYAYGFRCVVDTAITRYVHSTLGTDIYLAANDYIDIRVYHTQGGAVDISANAIFNFFNVHRFA